jgi:glycosyltransferase involved in cell wall biosynthesis
MTVSNMPTVSVIIPTHDRNDFLERAVRSAAVQSMRPVEIVVTDDLGRSGTKSLCESLASELQVNVIYLRNAEGGAPLSRNIGAAIATGEYLAFLDDDDYWDVSYLQTAISESMNSDVQIVLTGLLEIDEQGNTSPGLIPPSEYDVETLYLSNPGVLCSNVVIQKSIFDEIGGYDPTVMGSGDKDLLMQVYIHGYLHSIVEDRLVFWFRHAKQWSANSSSVRPSVVAFYQKYWRSMPLITHWAMLNKIARLYLRN